MNVERLAQEYMKQKELSKALASKTEQLRELLIAALDREGQVDQDGHAWLPAGDVLLKKEKRQPKPFLDKERAEEWLKRLGAWEDVREVVVTEVINEDALMAYVWDNKHLEGELKDLYITPEPSYALVAKEVKHYDY